MKQNSGKKIRSIKNSGLFLYTLSSPEPWYLSIYKSINIISKSALISFCVVHCTFYLKSSENKERWRCLNRALWNSIIRSFQMVYISASYTSDEGSPTLFVSEPWEKFPLYYFSLFSLSLLKDRRYFSRTEPWEIEWATPRQAIDQCQKKKLKKTFNRLFPCYPLTDLHLLQSSSIVHANFNCCQIFFNLILFPYFYIKYAFLKKKLYMLRPFPCRKLQWNFQTYSSRDT